VRIAFSTEIVRYCDEHDIDFYAVRDAVNAKCNQSDSASTDPNAVPSGGLLVQPSALAVTASQRRHIAPVAAIESKADMSNSLILQSVKSTTSRPHKPYAWPSVASALSTAAVALLGAAYRFNSEDTRNSPTLPLARLLLDNSALFRFTTLS